MSSNSLPNQQQQFDDVVLTIPDNRSPAEVKIKNNISMIKMFDF